MRRSLWSIAGLCTGTLGVCTLLSGCCSGLSPACKPRCSSPYSCARWDGANEAQVERGEIVVEPDGATSLADVNLILGDPRSAEYVSMTAPSVQCTAAKNASVPNLINCEIALLEYLADESKDRKQRVLLIQRDLTQLRQVTRRNEAAAAALNIYWQLANIEFQRGILERTLAEVRRSLSDFEELRIRQQPVPPDETTVKAQEVDLQDQLLTLEKTADQLNGQLRVLFGSTPGDGPFIWPETPLAVTVTPTDPDAAITVGLATRADLMSLRLVIATLDSDSLPLARAALQQSDGVLGAAQTKLRSLDCDEVSREVVVRNEQLGMLLADSQRAASEQIRQAALTVDNALRAVGLANQSVALRRQRTRDVEQLREAGVAGVTSFDLTAARIEVLKAESLLVRQIVAWKVAEVELKEAQGLLAAECGYPSIACHFQHCLNDVMCSDGSCVNCHGAPATQQPPTDAAPSEPSPPPAAAEVPAPVEARREERSIPDYWPTLKARPKSQLAAAPTPAPIAEPAPVKGTPAIEARYTPAPVVAAAPEEASAPEKSQSFKRGVSSAPTSAFGSEKW